jgi:hypothetical protein
MKRKPINPKRIHKIVKNDKIITKRTRKHVEVEDQNKSWEEKNMFETMIPNVAISRMNAISSSRNEILKQQKEASAAIQQINAEYNDLDIKYKKREKDAKIEIENKRKLEELKRKHDELSEHFKGQRKRNEELGDYQKTVDQ